MIGSWTQTPPSFKAPAREIGRKNRGRREDPKEAGYRGAMSGGACGNKARRAEPMNQLKRNWVPQAKHKKLRRRFRGRPKNSNPLKEQFNGT